MGKEIFSQCRLTVSEGIKSKDSKLIETVTQAGFEITSVSPLIIESNFTSKEDLLKLADVLTSSVEPQQCSSSAARSSTTFSLFSECQLTVSEEITSKDFELFEAVTEAGFKITKVRPLVLKKDSTSKEDLVKLADLLTSDDVTGAGSSSNRGQEQQKDTSRSTTKKSISADKVNIPEREVEDYVMKKHHFHLVGEYYFDRDWKELFGKAEETDDGFRFQMKDVSADEYGMLQRLKKIAFGTIGISDDEAHKVKEAAEYINCVDHGVCVIDYNSRPYIVGPKAQVHAAREEILYKLREDGVNCQLTSLKTLATQNDSEDKEKNIDNKSVDKVNAGVDRESTSSSETESDAESDTVEYIIGKNDFRLAKQYFEGRPEYQHFDRAAKRKGGYLFSFSSKATDCTLFIKTLRRLNFEAVSHRENDKPKVKSIADELKCGDLDVKVLEKGSTSFIVGPIEKVAEVKQKVVSKLQETDKNGDDLAICEKPKRQVSQPDMRGDAGFSRSSDGGARPKNSDWFRRSKDKDPYDFKFERDYTRNSSYQGDSMERYGRDAEPGVYTGRCSDTKVLIHNTDITTLDVDCIVNAANTKLKHGGGVARFIARAAGRELQEACERFIDAGNTVEVTGVFVSPGGRLPAKHVLHAVGPKWDTYSDKRKCTDDLRRTVLRCLVEAMRLGMSSIALPSISAALFKVPKEYCARSYMNAVKHFEEIIRKDRDQRDCTLKEIHFVDVDDTMVNYIRECFMNHWREPSDPGARQSDEKVFQEQLKSTKSQTPGNQISGPSQRSNRPSSPEDNPSGPCNVATLNVTGATAKRLEKDTVYQVGGLQLCISSRPALSIRSDLVITVGEEFDKLSGLPDYKVKFHKKPCDDVPTKKNCYTFSWIHKPNGKYGQLLCRLFPDPKSPEELSSALENLDPAIRLAALRGDKVEDVKTFVLTSSILYAEPNNRKKAPSFINRRLAGNFGKLVFDYVEKMSKESSCQVKQVVVTASEDVSVLLCKILETRPVFKNVSASVPGAYPHFRPRGQSPARRRAGAASYADLTSYGQPIPVASHSPRQRSQSPARSSSASSFSFNYGEP